MALYRQWLFLTGKGVKEMPQSEPSDCSTCEEQESPVLSSIDQNSAFETKPVVADYKPAAKSDTITLTGG